MTTIIKRIILNSKKVNIWRFVTNPGNFKKYIYGYISGRTIRRNRTGLSAEYEWYGKIGPFKLKSTERIVEWEERKLVAYTGKLLGIAFDSSMRVEEAKHNQTALTIKIKYTVPFFLGGAITDMLFIQRIVKTYIQNSLHSLEKRYHAKN